MGKKSDPPKPPDPKETAAAQTSTNIGTAIAQTALNSTDQITPDGSLTYEQTGSTQWTDPLSGKVYDLPKYTATQSLSDAQKLIKAQSDAAELNLAGIANDQSGFLKDYLNQPLDLNNDTVESRLYELGSKRLDPRFAEEQQRLEQSLADRGIKMGSDAYDRAIKSFGETKNDAYNQLLLSGRGEAVQEALTSRNQPINEIIALLSGSQIQQPNFVNTPSTGVANVDYAGLVSDNYKAKLAAWQQQQAQSQQFLGGLFGLGANLIGAF